MLGTQNYIKMEEFEEILCEEKKSFFIILFNFTEI